MRRANSIIRTNRRGLLRLACSGAALSTLGACSIFDDDEKPVLAGHRVDVLSTGAGLTVDPDDHTPITFSAPQNVKAWAQVGREPDHVSVNASWNGPNLSWSRSVGMEVNPTSILSSVAIMPNRRGAIQSPPVIGQGRIFTTDAQGEVKAWTWPGMKLLWSRQPKGEHSRSTNLGGGLALDGDTLYVVTGVALALALDAATGKVKWSADLGTPGRSAPTVENGLVVFGTIDERLIALDVKSGEQVWTYQATQADTVVFGQASPAIVDGIVLAGFGSGDLVALRAASGEMVWSDSLGGSNGLGAMLDFSCVRGAPVIKDGTAYAISMSRVLVAIDMRSGRRLWEREVSGQSPLCLCDDWLFVVSTDQQLACIDRLSGHVRWITQLRRFRRQEVQKDAVQWVGPLLVDGKLVCFSTLPAEGMIVADAKTGKILSRQKTPAACEVEPIVCDGLVLALSQDAVLRAYG
ncbi:PQQ-containing dehydrogenase 2 [Neokomagataea thailandica NBRC 106555]|uniref:Dehydrogenase n=2 Tax=Neokomagataea TaxID=1223423 RepID=A0A4Y6V2V1_9PROT|nr:MULTISPECIES: PQQ-like beta-propeller repeat protein [Neokomagataea]QDH24382.1 dehydrogenase [Neokomagataea tanensis]GBR53351.1 PQQ-containing dehydrogenase 2 [Neokomagataea thailandica NBRC 106555]